MMENYKSELQQNIIKFYKENFESVNKSRLNLETFVNNWEQCKQDLLNGSCFKNEKSFYEFMNRLEGMIKNSYKIDDLPSDYREGVFSLKKSDLKQKIRYFVNSEIGNKFIIDQFFFKYQYDVNKFDKKSRHPLFVSPAHSNSYRITTDTSKRKYGQTIYMQLDDQYTDKVGFEKTEAFMTDLKDKLEVFLPKALVEQEKILSELPIDIRSFNGSISNHLDALDEIQENMEIMSDRLGVGITKQTHLFLNDYFQRDYPEAISKIRVFYKAPNWPNIQYLYSTATYKLRRGRVDLKQSKIEAGIQIEYYMASEHGSHVEVYFKDVAYPKNFSEHRSVLNSMKNRQETKETLSRFKEIYAEMSRQSMRERFLGYPELRRHYQLPAPSENKVQTLLQKLSQ